VSPGLLRRIFLDDLGLKFLSLAFATLLWMFVVGEKRSEVSLSLPLELTRVEGVTDQAGFVEVEAKILR
jgi:hypothetical protein